jgi:uncharacterized lipoprotein NlpE involved in copper resistance
MSTFDYVLAIKDSAGTVTLTSAPFSVRTYQSVTAPPDQPTVAETFDVRLRDGSVTANLEELRTLQRLLRQAGEAQDNRTLNKVYLTWKESVAGTEYRSELVQARAEWQAEALQYAQWMGDTQFANVYIERRNWWEGPEAQLALSNPNGTATTSALTVGNDSTDNYVDVSGAAVAGDLPGATRLEATNTSGDSAGTGLYHLWVGQNYTNPSTYTPLIEGESGTSLGSSNIADADASGGEYKSMVVNSVASEAKMWSCTLSSALLTAAAGRFYKVLVRFFQDPRLSIRYRLKLTWNNAVVWQGPLVSIDLLYATSIRDLGTMRLPPWLPGLTSLSELTLEIHVIGANTVKLDYLYLMPVDGWRKLECIGYNLPANSRAMDDGIDDRLYADTGAGSDKIGLFVGYGQPIHLEPGKNQRLYFLQADNAGFAGADSSISRTLGVKLYYRPRRLSL